MAFVKCLYMLLYEQVGALSVWLCFVMVQAVTSHSRICT